MTKFIDTKCASQEIYMLFVICWDRFHPFLSGLCHCPKSWSYDYFLYITTPLQPKQSKPCLNILYVIQTSPGMFVKKGLPFWNTFILSYYLPKLWTFARKCEKIKTNTGCTTVTDCKVINRFVVETEIFWADMTNINAADALDLYVARTLVAMVMI